MTMIQKNTKLEIEAKTLKIHCKVCDNFTASHWWIKTAKKSTIRKTAMSPASCLATITNGHRESEA
jgi:hypothetical protein